MAIATEEQTSQDGGEEIRISNRRDLYRAVGRIEDKQDMLVNLMRSMEEQARENFRLLSAKIDTVKVDLDVKMDTVKPGLESKTVDLKSSIKKLDDKFNRMTLVLVGGAIVIIVANYLMQYLPRIN